MRRQRKDMERRQRDAEDEAFERAERSIAAKRRARARVEAEIESHNDRGKDEV